METKECNELKRGVDKAIGSNKETESSNVKVHSVTSGKPVHVFILKPSQPILNINTRTAQDPVPVLLIHADSSPPFIKPAVQKEITEVVVKKLKHPRTHTVRKRPFVCSICQLTFTREATLKEHVFTHSGIKTFVCGICKKSFMSRRNMRRHCRLHLKRKYACHICNKTLSHQSTLRSHLLIHSGEKPYVCSVCNKGHTTQSALHIHHRMHTGEKPYACDICYKRFPFRQNLDRHVIIHTDEKPFTCDICQKSFNHKNNMKIHRRRHLRQST